MRRNHVIGLTLAVICATAWGCGGYLRYLAKSESFTTTDSLALEEARPKNARTLSLGMHPNVARVILVGTHSAAAVRVSLSDDAKRVDLRVTVSGEFMTGSAEERALVSLKEFKTKLVEALQQTAKARSR